MTQTPRRGVTRGYVRGLIAAVTILGIALVVGSWGLIALGLSRSPVETHGIWVLAAEMLVGLALVFLVWGLWSQAVVLLKGRRTPSWSHAVALSGSVYLIWCLGGTLAGMTVAETWLSPFALALALIWAVSSIIFWAILARKVYTEQPVPQWPWERRGEPGPDWTGFKEGSSEQDSDGDDPEGRDPGDRDSGGDGQR